MRRPGPRTGYRPDPSKLGLNCSNFPRRFHHVHAMGKVESIPRAGGRSLMFLHCVSA